MRALKQIAKNIVMKKAGVARRDANVRFRPKRKGKR